MAPGISHLLPYIQQVPESATYSSVPCSILTYVAVTISPTSKVKRRLELLWQPGMSSVKSETDRRNRCLPFRPSGPQEQVDAPETETREVKLYSDTLLPRYYHANPTRFKWLRTSFASIAVCSQVRQTSRARALLGMKWARDRVRVRDDPVGPSPCCGIRERILDSIEARSYSSVCDMRPSLPSSHNVASPTY